MSKQQLKSKACEYCGSILRHKSTCTQFDRPRLPSLKSVLKEGNSDPFGTSLIVVDSTVSRLLEFNKKCILPSIHGREVDDGKTKTYASSYWRDSIASLQDECQGRGYLARFAAILAAVTSDRNMAATALVFKHRATELLRGKLAEHGKLQLEACNRKSSRTNLCWSVYSLFTADVAARNFEAAKIHARILRHFLQPDDPTVAVTDSRLLHAVLFNDIQRSSVSLTRPTFDLERLAADQIQTAVMYSEVSGSGDHTNQRYAAPIDSSLRKSDLWALLNQIRHLVAIAGAMVANPALPTDSLIVYLSTWVLICEGKLVNIIVSADEKKVQEKTDTLSSESEHQFGALAALYWLRRISQHEGWGVQLSLSDFKAGPIILTRLQKYLLSVDSSPPVEESGQGGKSNSYKISDRNDNVSDVTVPHPSKTSRLKLWVSYIAALAERASLAKRSEFQSRFLFGATSLGHRSWAEVRERALKSFLYDESVDPDTGAWFDRAIRGPSELSRST